MPKRYSSVLELVEMLVLLSAIAVLASLLLAGTSQVRAETQSVTHIDGQAAITIAGATFTPTPMDTPTQLVSPTASPSITATPTATLCPISFTDVHPTDYFYQGVSYLYCKGAISGYSDNTFRPYNNTTRAQLSKIIVLAEHWPINTQGGPHFTDVPVTSPFYEFVETAYNHQVISGYADGTFRPNNNVTRAQLCKVIVIAQGYDLGECKEPHFCDVNTSNPFFCYVMLAYDWGLINGYSDCTFRPYNPTTRGQLSKVVYLAVTAP